MFKGFALVCAVMLAILAFGPHAPVIQADVQATPAATEAATQQAAALANGWALAPQKTETNAADLTLTITITKPVLGGGNDPRIGHFNAAVDYLTSQIVDNFKEELKQYGTPSPEMPKDLPGNALDINYQVFVTTERVVSVQFAIYYYVTGAAHPNSYTVPLNYDLKTDKVLALADLFKPKADYLTILSNAAVNELKKKPDIFLFPDGAAPKEENYRSWNIRPDGLLITFDPYQVAPYAAGPQQVVVPYQILKPVIDPAGPLAAFGAPQN